MYHLPVRLGYTASRKEVILGEDVTYGDAGWATVACSCEADALELMARYPQARMPCWQRIESANGIATGGEY